MKFLLIFSVAVILIMAVGWMFHLRKMKRKKKECDAKKSAQGRVFKKDEQVPAGLKVEEAYFGKDPETGIELADFINQNLVDDEGLTKAFTVSTEELGGGLPEGDGNVLTVFE